MEIRKKKTMDEEKNDNRQKTVSGIARYSGLFFQMFFIIGLFVFGGVQLDERTENQQRLYTAALGLLGVVVALYHVLKEVNQINKSKK
jgi:hypothetical protein